MSSRHQHDNGGQRSVVRLASAALILVPLFIQGARAFDYEVTDYEWASWPEYCKVRYASTPVGAGRGNYTKADARKWSETLGGTYLHIHHYCAGLISIQRAQRYADADQSRRWYNESLGAIAYTYRGSEPDFPLFSQMSAYYGKALYETGQTAEAQEILQTGIKTQPEAPESYIMLAEIARKEGDREAARKVLESYYERGGKPSAELDYNLAYVYMLEKDYDNARKYTKSALAGGYPLQGIKERLKALGHWR